MSSQPKARGQAPLPPGRSGAASPGSTAPPNLPTTGSSCLPRLWNLRGTCCRVLNPLRTSPDLQLRAQGAEHSPKQRRGWDYPSPALRRSFRHHPCQRLHPPGTTSIHSLHAHGAAGTALLGLQLCFFCGSLSFVLAAWTAHGINEKPQKMGSCSAARARPSHREHISGMSLQQWIFANKVNFKFQ